MKYFVKTPWWIKKIYPFYTWSVPTKEKVLYLTFDDGPHPDATPFVLRELKKFDALATFFCIGKNVLAWPDIYQTILNEGHAVGNHTQNHVNGWNIQTDTYLKDIAEAANYIDSNLFRPPYGRITLFQAKNLKAAMKGKTPEIIMWDVLSADFDTSITAEQSLQFVIFRSVPGSIIVFHDSEKAYSKLSYVLPKVLHHFSKQGFRFLSLKSQPQKFSKK
jgi:peptidoglycan-N-acetylglucosamine deacetylase